MDNIIFVNRVSLIDHRCRKWAILIGLCKRVVLSPLLSPQIFLSKINILIDYFQFLLVKLKVIDSIKTHVKMHISWD